MPTVVTAAGTEIRAMIPAMPVDLWIPFATGLLGSAHCLGMCGGFVLYYVTRFQGRPPALLHLVYHTGRLLAYVLLGGIMGAVGSFADTAARLQGIQRFSLLAGAILMVAGGIVLAGFGAGSLSANLNPADTGLFRRLFRRLTNPGRIGTVLPLGFLLGFIPCGLVYTLSIGAAASGGIVPGGMIMAAFGAGTLPALVGFGTMASRLTNRSRTWMNRAAAVLIVLMGARGLLRWAALTGWISHGIYG